MSKVVPFHSVVIFGGAGFIGSNWAYRLLKTTEARVHIFDNLSRRGVQHNVSWLRRVAGDSDRLQITVGDGRDGTLVRSEERRGGEEGRSRWAPDHLKKKKKE